MTDAQTERLIAAVERLAAALERSQAPLTYGIGPMAGVVYPQTMPAHPAAPMPSQFSYDARSYSGGKAMTHWPDGSPILPQN
jgi:hypothetical protein